MIRKEHDSRIEIRDRDSMRIRLMNAKNRVSFLLEFLSSKVYRRDMRDSSS